MYRIKGYFRKYNSNKLFMRGIWSAICFSTGVGFNNEYVLHLDSYRVN